ncbi:hypothetical protein EDC18_101362 [Natranaerovirga pectinivora]|uniref:Flavoprotein n=1 Tax=Natranaerovirga pectinivora TaxID=682400 RepID=A0A4R3MUT5_9FIRM|nr:NAD(P)/FAD-dependent oxidoreductase [Natranaerovirga pectinivora]TCT17066.1 hypothetical protein EDC18_101362 [Natranaerovirga pectinivora]
MGKNTVAIIGGGASGLVAGIVSARGGAKVTIIERMDRLGKKILATGNGRCNLTNTVLSVDHFNGENPKFSMPVLSAFDVEKTIEFFNGLGIYPRVENGYVYPYSNQASSVLDVLRQEIEQLKINVVYEEEVKEIEKKKNQFIIHTNGNKYYTNKVILCAGGNSTPNLGSNGSGFDLAKKLGHRIVSPYPALVQIKASENYLKRIKGVRVIAKLHLYIDDTLKREEVGEVLFTDYGLSGIPILQISRYIGEAINNGKKIKVLLDLIPELETEALDKILVERFTNMPYKSIEDNLIGLLNKKLIPIITHLSDIKDNQPVSQISKSQRHKLIESIKNLTFNITGTNDWNQSQVTVGGVATDEVDPNTLESKIHPNLYFAGEILDIDGDCGGYNLQWAWSSGYIAGKTIVKKTN